MAYLCPVCGIEFIPFTNGKPKIYHSDNCRDFAKFKSALERSILKLEPTSAASSLIRGDMFRLANLLSNGTNFSRTKKQIGEL